ncbi:putative monooxygenase p33MONOX [Hemiscyllium ocellatum]|uniref:putative monooxygenase p33MONOX n=1 Tax=Hemiscyllium ocellatum TaxID=170820 RepID=UPI002966EB04|nr:putative monooxygenase p33MONOX [Hemiscyllium ocellatum]XP_060693112.1 putative monooxygenase p33MONOX [Hemiscyllium ocellatum]
MASNEHNVPAIEHPSSLLGKLTLPIGIHRRAFSYDDALEDLSPMTPPPPDMGSNILWKQPVIPERKYQQLSMVEDGENISSSIVAPIAESESKVNVVKAKATSVIMNSLMTKQTQESIQRFEKQAGLTDAGYQPHKGLVAEEASYHRVGEALQKFKIQSMDSKKEDKQISTSAQSTPSGTPQASPMPNRRYLFGQGATSDLSSKSLDGDFSTLASDSTAAEKWRPFMLTQNFKATEPGAFAIQNYKGLQKPSPMDIMRTQGTAAQIAEDHANLKPPNMELSVLEGQKKQPLRTCVVKPRDLNIFAPTGF